MLTSFLADVDGRLASAPTGLVPLAIILLTHGRLALPAPRSEAVLAVAFTTDVAGPEPSCPSSWSSGMSQS